VAVTEYPMDKKARLLRLLAHWPLYFLPLYFVMGYFLDLAINQSQRSPITITAIVILTLLMGLLGPVTIYGAAIYFAVEARSRVDLRKPAPLVWSCLLAWIPIISLPLYWHLVYKRTAPVITSGMNEDISANLLSAQATSVAVAGKQEVGGESLRSLLDAGQAHLNAREMPEASRCFEQMSGLAQGKLCEAAIGVAQCLAALHKTQEAVSYLERVRAQVLDASALRAVQDEMSLLHAVTRPINPGGGIAYVNSIRAFAVGSHDTTP
jgi:hypothetical protein